MRGTGSGQRAAGRASGQWPVASGGPKGAGRDTAGAAGSDSADHLIPHPLSLIPVNLPVPVAVERGADGEPAAVEWRGRWLEVTAVIDRWRIDDEWWREEIARLYRRVVLADDRVLTVFEDLLSGRWYVQRYRMRAGEVGKWETKPVGSGQWPVGSSGE